MKTISKLTNAFILGATGTPTFDNTAAQTAAKAFLEPLTTFALWAIPLVTAVVILISGISWMTMEEDEKEQKPFMKQLKKILLVAVLLECVPTLLKIFGIA
ncbi:MAG: hypothetical protein RR929_01560 [Erysipelotrichaceae bacterium]